MSVFAWLVTALDGCLLLAFAAYLVSLRRLPVARRPRIAVYVRRPR